ncbi:MAG: hypothetical protein GYA48_03455 [Chloroflexi bacterium]|nr:hypothetical protein [Chloroflexota bacterium]
MPKDLNEYRKETDRRLIIGGLAILFIVGGGLIYAFYGSGAALSGLLCAAFGLFPVLAIVLLFWLLDKFLKNNQK